MNQTAEGSGSSFILHPSSFQGGGRMEIKLDEGLKTLLDQGKEKGYLTFTQVNDYLPDDAVNPEKLDQLILMLEEQGIELIDEEDVADREGSPAGAAAAETDAAADLDLSVIDED